MTLGHSELEILACIESVQVNFPSPLPAEVCSMPRIFKHKPVLTKTCMPNAYSRLLLRNLANIKGILGYYLFLTRQVSTQDLETST